MFNRFFGAFRISWGAAQPKETEPTRDDKAAEAKAAVEAKAAADTADRVLTKLEETTKFHRGVFKESARTLLMIDCALGVAGLVLYILTSAVAAAIAAAIAALMLPIAMLALGIMASGFIYDAYNVNTSFESAVHMTGIKALSLACAIGVVIAYAASFATALTVAAVAWPVTLFLIAVCILTAMYLGTQKSISAKAAKGVIDEAKGKAKLVVGEDQQAAAVDKVDQLSRRLDQI